MLTIFASLYFGKGLLNINNTLPAYMLAGFLFIVPGKKIKLHFGTGELYSYKVILSRTGKSQTNK